MSPVSNKFEGIPQQQRYQTETVWMLKPLLCEIVFVLFFLKYSYFTSPNFFSSSTSSNTKSTLGPRVLPKLPQKGTDVWIFCAFSAGS